MDKNSPTVSSLSPIKIGIYRLKRIYFPAKWDLAKYNFAATYARGNRCVLDAGCSEGYGSSVLLRAGTRTVVGGDIDTGSVAYARNNYACEGSHFLRLYATRLPFRDDCFDIVVALEIIEHLTELQQRQFFVECKRVLKNGGIIICSTPNKQTYTATRVFKLLHLGSDHANELFIPEFHNMLAEHFSDIALFGQWFLNPIGVMGHKAFLTSCFILERFASFFCRKTRIGSFIYRVIVSVVIPDKHFDVWPLINNPSRQPLNVICVAKVTKQVNI